MKFPRKKLRGRFMPYEAKEKAFQLPKLKGLFYFLKLKLTDRRDVHGRGAFLALRDVKGNPVAVFQ